MDIPLNAEVKCADGSPGKSICIIVNPVHNEVTHFVMETDGLMGLQYLVPVALIEGSTPHSIQLRCNRTELIDLDPFVRSQFIGPEDVPYRYYQPTAFGSGDTLLWPYSRAEDFGMAVAVEQIPVYELGFHRGARVEAIDGHIGKVDEFIVNPENNYITHLVLSEGHLWSKKDVTIPVSDVLRIEDDVVYLKLKKDAVKKMPARAVD